jgi:hypothetical protein
MKPEWFDLNTIPYENMWDDDKIWMPRIIDGEEYVEYNFWFDDDGKVERHEKIC